VSASPRTPLCAFPVSNCRCFPVLNRSQCGVGRRKCVAFCARVVYGAYLTHAYPTRRIAQDGGSGLL
jgi:hypothetical protein